MPPSLRIEPIMTTPPLDKTRLRQSSVLVVDDDPDLQTVLHDLLESEGHAVIDASTCQEALHHIQTRTFDAVLLDIGLPDGDGFSVLDEMQQLTPVTRVIMVTAAVAKEARLKALAQGAFAFLSKPYNHCDLRFLLRQAIGTTTGGTGSNPLSRQ